MSFVHSSKNSLGQHYIDMTLKSNKYLMAFQKKKPQFEETDATIGFSSFFFFF